MYVYLNSHHAHCAKDYTSVCILEGFKNENAAKSMEKILKKISELKAKELIKVDSINVLRFESFP